MAQDIYSDNRKQVYDLLKEGDVNGLGSPEEFAATLDDDDNRRQVYGLLSKLGVEGLGDYDTFSSTIYNTPNGLTGVKIIDEFRKNRSISRSEARGLIDAGIDGAQKAFQNTYGSEIRAEATAQRNLPNRKEQDVTRPMPAQQTAAPPTTDTTPAASAETTEEDYLVGPWHKLGVTSGSEEVSASNETAQTDGQNAPQFYQEGIVVNNELVTPLEEVKRYNRAHDIPEGSDAEEMQRYHTSVATENMRDYVNSLSKEALALMPKEATVKQRENALNIVTRAVMGKKSKDAARLQQEASWLGVTPEEYWNQFILPNLRDAIGMNALWNPMGVAEQLQAERDAYNPYIDEYGRPMPTGRVNPMAIQRIERKKQREAIEADVMKTFEEQLAAGKEAAQSKAKDIMVTDYGGQGAQGTVVNFGKMREANQLSAPENAINAAIGRLDELTKGMSEEQRALFGAQMYQQLQGRLVNERKANNTIEQIFKSAFLNSVTGKMTVGAVQTDYENYLDQLAAKAYDPSFMTEVASEVGSFLFDFWTFLGPQAVGGLAARGAVKSAVNKISKDLVVRGLGKRQAGRIAEQIASQSLKTKVGSHAISGATTFGLHGFATSPVNTLTQPTGAESTRSLDAMTGTEHQEPTVGPTDIIGRMFTDMGWGAAGGALFGAGAIPEHYITNRFGHGLASSLAGKGASIATNAAGMTGVGALEYYDENGKPMSWSELGQNYLKNVAMFATLDVPGFIASRNAAKKNQYFRENYEITPSDVAKMRDLGFGDRLTDIAVKLADPSQELAGRPSRSDVTDVNALKPEDRDVTNGLHQLDRLYDEGAITEKEARKWYALLTGDYRRGLNTATAVRAVETDGKHYVEWLDRDGRVIDRQAAKSSEDASTTVQRETWQVQLNQIDALEKRVVADDITSRWDAAALKDGWAAGMSEEYISALRDKESRGEALTEEEQWVLKNNESFRSGLEKMSRGESLSKDEQQSVDATMKLLGKMAGESGALQDIVMDFESRHGLEHGKLKTILEKRERSTDEQALVEDYVATLQDNILGRERVRPEQFTRKQIEGPSQEETGLEGNNRIIDGGAPEVPSEANAMTPYEQGVSMDADARIQAKRDFDAAETAVKTAFDLPAELTADELRATLFGDTSSEDAIERMEASGNYTPEQIQAVKDFDYADTVMSGVYENAETQQAIDEAVAQRHAEIDAQTGSDGNIHPVKLVATADGTIGQAFITDPEVTFNSDGTVNAKDGMVIVTLADGTTKPISVDEIDTYEELSNAEELKQIEAENITAGMRDAEMQRIEDAINADVIGMANVNGAAGTANTPDTIDTTNTPASPAGTQQPTLRHNAFGVPMKEDNTPDYEAAPAEAVWNTLTNESDEATASTVASTMASNYQKQLDKAKKKQATGNTPQEIMASAKANKEEVERLTALVEHWNNVAAVPTTRQQAETSNTDTANQQPIDSSESRITNTPDTSQTNGQENEGGNGNSGTVIDGRPRSNQRKASLTPMQQRERALGDYLDFYDYVERMLAASGRGLKVIWGDDPVTGTRGLGAHLTGKSESERRQYIWLLGTKKNGAFYPEQLAEELWQGYREERNDNGLPIDDIGNEQASDAFAVVLDVLRSHNRKESMMREAEERHSDMQRQYDEAERDHANNWAIGQGYKDIDEWQADYEQTMEHIKEIYADYEAQFINFAEEYADREWQTEQDYNQQRVEELSRDKDRDEALREIYEQENDRRSESNQREGEGLAGTANRRTVRRRDEESPAVVRGEQEISAENGNRRTNAPARDNQSTGVIENSPVSLGTRTGEGREVGRAQSGNLPASVAPLVAELERQSDERDALHQAWLSGEIDDSENRQRLRALDEQMSELRRRIMPLLSSLSQEELNAISAYGEEHQLVELPIFVEDEERRRKVAKTEADRFAEGLEAQGSIPHGKAVAKFKASDFASKDSKHTALGGTYYDPDGYAVTTDGFVLIADKLRYEPTKEGKVVAERNIPTVAGKGMEINAPYPNWKAVIPTGGQRVSVDWNDLLGFIAGVRAKMKVKYDELRERGDLDKTSFRAYTANATVQVRLPNGEIALFDLSRLERMAAAGAYLGTTELQYKGNDRAVLSANANGTALVMPMNDIPDEATSYYYDMSGSDMVGEPTTFYNTLGGQQVVYQNMFDAGNGKTGTNGQAETAASSTAPVQRSLFDNVESQPQAEAEAEQPTTEPSEQAEAETTQVPSEPQQPKPARTPRGRAADRIEDFGEKIGGARKDVVRARIQNTKKLTVKDLQALKNGPDDILSKSNIMRLYNEGQMDEATARSFMAFNSVVKLRPKEKTVLTKYRDAATAWEEGKPFSFDVTDDDVRAYLETFPHSNEEKARESLNFSITWPFNNFMRTYEALNYPAEDRKIGRYVIVDYTNSPYTFMSSRPYWVKNGHDARRGYPSATFESAVEKLKALCPVVQAKEKKAGKGESAGHGLSVVQGERGGYYIKSRNIPGKIYLSRRFWTRKEAEDYLAANLDALIKKEDRMTEALMGSNIGMAERAGVDYRNGRDVTPQDFLDEFGFRGVEFGNWVPQAERQMYLNKSYDAIKDLCAIIGISPRAFSLGGRLGLAFGARGHSKALAHYESDKEVINLTRMKGVGSLAHEWFHAIDNYLSRQKTGNISDFATETRDTVRREVGRVFDDLNTAMRALDYHRRSQRAGDYWGQTVEEFARLFEGYIYDKLTEKGLVSPILVRPHVLLDDMPSFWPYPSREENAVMRPLFDRLFDTIQEKTDANGNVMLQEPQTIYNTLDGQRVVYQSLFEGDRGDDNNSANRASGQALADEIAGMSDAQLLGRIGESGANDRDFYADEYDRRHEQEYDDAQLAYAQQLEQSNTSLDDAYGMYGDVSRRWLNGGYATDERTALRAQMDALTPYIDFLETERYDEEMEAEREAEREAAKQQYEEQKEAVEMFDPTTLRLRKLEPGETCRVERVYEETGQFNFTGKEKIESAEDVAFIFKQLETASVENAFLVLLKDGRPTIVHLGIGSYNKALAPFETAFVAYQKLQPESVVLVHNHPSGNVRASAQDINLQRQLVDAFGADVVKPGIIINTTSGKYGEFYADNTRTESQMPQAQGNEIPIKVYQFSKQVFAPDWNPAEAFKADGSLKVAQFVSSHRLGEHKKMSLLVVTQDMRVVANVFLPWTKLSEIKSYAEAGDLLAGYVHQCGGVRCILYGNYDYTKEDDNRLSRLSQRMKQLQAPFLEVMHIGHSAFESGLLGEPETAFNEGSEEIFNAAKEKFGRTYDIREAGYVLPDGTMLDFSGRHELFGADDSAIRGSRATDHREISKIAYKYDNDGNEIETGIETDMPDFIKRGGIRIDDNAGTINLAVKPTPEQREVLRRLIQRNDGDVSVDFGDGWDSDHYVEYEGARPQSVLADIDRYFDEGIKPEGNVTLGEPEVDYNAVNEPQFQLTDSESVRPATQEEREETAYMAEHLNAMGIPVSTDWDEGQRVLDMANGEGVRLQKRLNNLSKASNAIKRWLAEGARGKVFTIDLPESTLKMIRREVGRDFDSHNITINGIIHGLKNHGENGTKLSANSIPIREQDAELIPYIMTAPDYVRKGSSDITGRESVRFYKTLENGYVVVVEKEYEKSPNDMETINIWAEKSSRVADARSNERPLRSTSSPTNVAHGTEAARANAVTVITRTDAAKIRRDAEIAIENDEKNAKYQKANVSQAVFVSNARRAVEGIRQEKATPEQWLAMLQKQGGLKAGEDKWLGLSDWLKDQDKKSLTKQEVLDFIDQNQIQIEEVNYSENVDILSATERDIQENIARGHSLEELQEQIDTEIRLAGDELDGMDASERDEWLTEQMKDRYGDDFEVGYSISDGTISYAIGEWDVDEDAYNSNIAGDDNKKINTTRLEYTTEGLENKREIALTVPTIESWNEDDDIHFGDAGGGRAVAWIRFGETTDKDGNRVLVIDEIQSKRHQEGREKGYKENLPPYTEDMLSVEKDDEGWWEIGEKIGNGVLNLNYYPATMSREAAIQEYIRLHDRVKPGIPDAPFEKNWHELAMKRMLRYAAENGYDRVAWTTGEQQAERYNLGGKVKKITARDEGNFGKVVNLHFKENATTGMETMNFSVDENGIVKSKEAAIDGKRLSDVVGKDLAEKIMSIDSNRPTTFNDVDLSVGGEGMKGFYDRMLPNFVQKYTKKWGAKVGEVELPGIGDQTYRLNSKGKMKRGLSMWSVDVTPEMKRDVMQGQPMFFRTPDGQAYGFTLNGKIYLDPRIATAETPIHEYGHLWVEALAEANPEAWEHLKGELEQDTDLVNYVKGRYPDLEGDELWEEVFTHFSGRRGRERMEEERRRMMNEEPDLMGKARVARMFYRLRRALKRFWTMARDLFAGNNARLKTMKAEDFADAMMADLVHGFNPRTGELAEQRIRRMADKYVPRYQFVGERGARQADLAEERTHRIDNLTVAREMEDAGKDAVAIKLATGWERGGDGKWRYEIPDIDRETVVKGLREPIKAHRKAVDDMERQEERLQGQAFSVSYKIPKRLDSRFTEEEKAKYRQMREKAAALEGEALSVRKEINALKDKVEKDGYETTLGDVLGKDSELIKAYPSLADVHVKVFEHLQGKQGSYSSETNTLELNAGERSIDSVYSTMLHEIQHAIQHIEGFARGGNLGTVLSDNAYLMNFRDNLLGTLVEVEKQLKETRDQLAAQDFSRYTKEALTSREANLQLDALNINHTLDDLDNNRISQDIADRYYRRLGGEVEARNVQRRRGYSEEERRRSLAVATEDVGRDEQHFLFGEDESKSAADNNREGETLFAEKDDKRQGGMPESPARELAEKLNLGDRIEFVIDTNTLTDTNADNERRMRRSKGFFDTNTGKIIIVLPNHTSEDDVLRTVLHESVAHYGLRELFKDDFDTFLDNVYNNVPLGIKARIHDYQARRKCSLHEATEEYLASLAEDTNFEQAEKTGVWPTIKRLLITLLRSAHVRLPKALSDEDLRYILWRSFDNLRTKGRPNIIDRARDITMQSRLGVRNFTSGQNNTNQNRLFRDADELISDDKVLARAMYEERLKTSLFQITEALQDSMLGLKEAYRAIASAEGAKDFKIEDIPSYENAYLAENALSSVNKAEMDAYAEQVFRPLMDEVARLAKNKEGKEQLIDYLMAKHGLERNRVMAQREFDKYQEKHPSGKKTLADFRRDYAGLTAIFGEEGDALGDIERKAGEYVENYESQHDTDELWERIREATRYSVYKSFTSGIINKKTFDEISNMYEYYIPLRGFDEATSDEIYTYLNGRDGVFNAPIRTARGRVSKADDPLATIKNMADSGILQGNRNLMKQKFLNYVMRHPSNLASVHDLWLKRDDVTGEWTPVFPDINPNDTPEEVERKVNAFEERMIELQESDPTFYKRGHEATDIPFKVINGNMKEHQVLVKRNGRNYVITINGNPRAAQALNGQTNPDNETTGAVGAVLRAGEWVNRQLSTLYTTKNPDFIASNFLRDAIYANSMTWVKESPAYAAKFHANFIKFNPITMGQLFKKYNEGTLDRRNKTERYFAEFMHGGGETGYSNLKSVEQQKREIDKELKRANGKLSVTAGLRLLGKKLDDVNRAVENCARFAAFVTSREDGRDIPRSVWDAKEISVNFNKKGAGAKFYGEDNLPGNIASLVSGLGRASFVFWNAAVQGTANITRYAKRHPAKFATAAATLFVLGALIPAMAGGGGDEDDKNAYFNLPEYVRRSNIMFRLGEQWLSIPLPIEYRAIYGLGELLMSAAQGQEDIEPRKMANKMASQLSQVLPLDFLEGGGGLNAFVPSWVKPMVEVGINKSWTGLPIAKETPFNKDMPAWTKTYKNTDQNLISLAASMNEATGGDEFTKGWADWNPAKLEYLLNGYLGGISNTIEKLAKTGETMVGKRDFDWRDVLIVNRVIKTGDERTAFRKANEKYYTYKEEFDKFSQRLRGYKKRAEEGDQKYLDKLDELNNSKDMARYEIFKEYDKKIAKLKKRANNLTGTDEEKEAVRELNREKLQLVETIDGMK